MRLIYLSGELLSCFKEVYKIWSYPDTYRMAEHWKNVVSTYFETFSYSPSTSTSDHIPADVQYLQVVISSQYGTQYDARLITECVLTQAKCFQPAVLIDREQK